MAGVRANVRDGNKQISLATEDMFIWGQVHTDTPFYFPNREALLDLYPAIVDTPGVEHHVFSHSTIAPAVVDPVLIEKLTEICIDKSPIKIPLLSTPSGEARDRAAHRPRDRLGARGQADHAEQGRAVPDRRLAERVHPRPRDPEQATTGSRRDAHHRQPGRDRRGLAGRRSISIYEVERRGLFAFFIPSIFTPLHDTRMEKKKGVTETAQLTPLQWQLMMKCWKMNLRPGQMSWWGPTAWRARRDRPVGLTSCASSTARASRGR